MPLICEVKLSKESGITVTVINEMAMITQTIHMDGTAITTKVTGPMETSTIVQKQDSIAIKCKTFTLDAETITCTSTMDTKHVSQQQYLIESTADYKLTSQAKIVSKAARDHTMSAMNIKADAMLNVNVSGLNIEEKALIGVKLSGLQFEAAGTATARLSGAKVDVAADGMLGCSSGGLTNVSGSMVTVGAALIKLG